MHKDAKEKWEEKRITQPHNSCCLDLYCLAKQPALRKTAVKKRCIRYKFSFQGQYSLIVVVLAWKVARKKDQMKILPIFQCRMNHELPQILCNEYYLR